jgi:hypothetical protein
MGTATNKALLYDQEEASLSNAEMKTVVDANIVVFETRYGTTYAMPWAERRRQKSEDLAP